MKSYFINLLILLISTVICLGSETDDTTSIKKKETIKTGWTFGAVPAISYDTDIGFKYGGVINFFYHGDGSTYPKYWHSIYLEWSQTTKGSGINQIIFDSDSILKNIRTFVEFSYLTEKLLDFYGYNGYEAFYNSTYENQDSDDYLSRMYYRQERKLLRLRGDLLGNIGDSPFKWFAGVEYYNIKLDTIDLDKVNEGKKESEIIPATDGGLYGKYEEWGLLPADQFDGGVTSFLKTGLVYDTRDNEANPNKGLWTEFQYLIAPGFLGNDYSFSKLVLIFRHYLTIFPKKLTFAYRLSYQGKITGQMPSYLLPFIFNSPPSLTRDGMGGSKTIRGVLRNRVVGEDYLFGNFELRWKCYKTLILNQNFYISWNFFFDTGKILKKYKLQQSQNTEVIEYLNMGNKDGFHHGVVTGLRLLLNDNFIVALDYGIPLKNEDGDRGFYMGLNFLF